MTILDSPLKSRDITLPRKVCLVKANIFPGVIYGYENWTIKPECQRIDAFELWCWKRLLRVPWTSRRSNQSILKEISPECFLEGLMLKLKLQYFGHLMQRADSLEKNPDAGKDLKAGEGDDRGWDGWMASVTHWTWVCVNSRSWWWTRRPDVLQSMGSQRVRHDWVTELNWTELNHQPVLYSKWKPGWLMRSLLSMPNRPLDIWVTWGTCVQLRSNCTFFTIRFDRRFYNFIPMKFQQHGGGNLLCFPH